MTINLLDDLNNTMGEFLPSEFTSTFTETPGTSNMSDSAGNISEHINTTTHLMPYASEYDTLLAESKEIIFSIQYGLLPFFLLTGLIGNCLTIVTMASRVFSHMTSRYILIFLAISDTVLLLTQPFNKLWIMKLFGRDLRALSDTTCKAFFVIFKSSKMTSSWLVVLLCFERFVAVVYPLKVKTILKKRVIFPAIAIDYIFMFIYNSVWSFSSQVVGGICKPDVPSVKHKVFVIIGCTLYSFLPTLLLMIFTPQIIYKLRNQVSIRRALSVTSSSNRGYSKGQEDMIRASYMVLGVMIAYIILIIPITLVHLIAFIKGVSAFDETSYGFFIFREVAQMLEQINYAVNFFFYVMCSTNFRRRVLDIVCCRGLRSLKRNNEISSTGSKKTILSKVMSISSANSVENNMKY